MDEIMNKIPVKIIEITSPSGQKAVEVMLDVFDYYEIKGNVQKKLKDFKNQYFEIVKKSQKIIPKKKSERKASNHWKMGKLLLDFKKSIGHEFEITNFNTAIVRDFGLYQKSAVGHFLQFGEYFRRKEVLDSIPLSYYIELIWKATQLKKLGLFEKEKKRLLKMSKEKTLPNREKYHKELNKLTRKTRKRSKN